MEHKAYTDIYSLENNHWWFKGRRRIAGSLLDVYAPEQARFAVDVGCCTGLNTVLLGKYAKEVVGWDMSPQAVELARHKHPEVKVQQVVFPEGIADSDKGKYSIVAFFDVLEHIKDDKAAIKAVEDLLEPGGVAIIMVPAFALLWTEHDKVLHHYRRYTRSSLRDLIFRNTSLKLADLNYFNFFLFAPVFFIRMVKKILNIRTGSADDSFPIPRSLNGLLAAIFGSERWLFRWLSLPFGVSLFAVLRKGED